jgi:hypothetical protein
MLRHTAFAIAGSFVCGVASAQQPLTPYLNYGSGINPAVNCPNGFCGTPQANCPNGNCGTGGMICGPNGCYVPRTAPAPYLPRLPLGNAWTQPAGAWRYPASGNYRIQPYPTPSSSYPGFPNIPVARDRHVPTSGYPMFQTPAPLNHPYNYYPPVTGASDQYDAFAEQGTFH